MTLVTHGLGDVYLITQGFAVSEEEVAEVAEEVLGGGGGRGRKRRRRPNYPELYPFFKPEVKPPTVRRSKNANLFIRELTGKIKETGVVKNKHVPYHPVRNKRYKVEKKQARRIAYNIAKGRGLRVGKFR